MPLESGEGLELLGARAEPVTYQGRRAIRLEPLEGAAPGKASLAIQPGVWTRMRVKVSGTRAELYVDDAEQPSLTCAT